MTQSIWSSDMATGMETMDDLHHDFLDTLARLSDAQEKDFVQRYAIFLRKVEHAFANEEMWMEEIDFPDYKYHLEQHARVLASLHQIHSKIMQGELSEGQYVVTDLLPQWFAFHISTMDRALGTAINTVKAGSSSANQALEYVD